MVVLKTVMNKSPFLPASPASQTPTLQRSYLRGRRPWHADCAAWILPPLLLLFSVPATVVGDQEGDFGYSTDGSTVTITNYTGSGGVVAMPDTIAGLPVTSIGYRAFYERTNVTSLTFPNTITAIASYAFCICTSLTNLTIPDSITRIEPMTFYYCTSLRSITIPDPVTSIGDWAFAYSRSLTQLTIGSGVTNIGDFAFYGSWPFSNVTIPDRVGRIGNWAFAGCYSLAAVTVGEGVAHLGDSAFADCVNLAGAYFKGDAPSLGTNVFTNDIRATVYYLPGAAGWGETFGERPTAIWRPRVETGGASFGVQTNRFGFTITWASDKVVVVEAATDLVNPTWSPVATNTLAVGSSYFSDPQWSSYPRRFYRVRSP